MGFDVSFYSAAIVIIDVQAFLWKLRSSHVTLFGKGTLHAVVTLLRRLRQRIKDSWQCLQKFQQGNCSSLRRVRNGYPKA